MDYSLKMVKRKEFSAETHKSIVVLKKKEKRRLLHAGNCHETAIFETDGRWKEKAQKLK